MGMYAKELPQDKNRNPYPAPPAVPAEASWKGVPLAASTIGISPNTTVIDVTCLGGQSANSLILGKWGAGVSSVAGGFDWVVASGNTRTFVVPVSVMGTGTGAPVANNGLYTSISVVNGNAQSASVFGVEY